MDGRLIPSVSSTPAGLHFAHRVLATVVGALVLLLLARAVRERPAGDAVRLLALTGGLLFMAQVLIGAANVWSRLAPAAVVAHVAVAGLTWGAAVATAVTAGAVPAGDRARGDLASVAR
jgi:heme A synthase